MVVFDNIEVIQIDNDEFWCLFDELCDDNSSFLYDRYNLLHAYENGYMYGLRVVDPNLVCKWSTMKSTPFCCNSSYLLPCFCVKENDKAKYIWTHTRVKDYCFDKQFTQLLGII